MDIGKLLKNVHNLNEYISTTQDASEKCKSSKIQLNMSTVLALKKIRSLEIEYFNKCEENGIACLIFERMLCLPPSKTWGVLSKELVNLLQYWLDAIRKHLVRHNLQWWSFLKLLLRFVKEIRTKDASLPNILVEHTAECFLDLASNSRPDAFQRHEILHYFNMYCSESSREIRFAMRNKFAQYFVKLSTYMSSCGHLPTQYSIMETLLRWLLPRQDRTLRVASAAKWFPPALYEDQDVGIFLERPWVNFFQDARDFLNAHNQRHDFVTSVVCRKLTVGNVVIISGMERQESWLDMNLVSRCVSVLLDPRILETFGSHNHKSFETLVVTHQNTHTAKLHKESVQLFLTIQTLTPPQVLPSCVNLSDDVSCDVTAVVTTRCDVRRLDQALRKIFEEKYQLLLDLDKELEQSPHKGSENLNHNKDMIEDPRFSHPVEVKRRKHSGYIVKPRQPLSCMSPSTASTSSLAQLHEKLAALPRYRYDKEPVSVCALPELSIVTEISEADDKQSLNTTLKYKPYGVCYKNLNTLESRKSQSDPESSRKSKSKGRRLSPIVHEETASCLLVATIGSTDDSVINDTVERLSKSKDYNADNIVDLLVQEALQAKDYRDKLDSGINTGEKKSDLIDNNETIDNTPEVVKVKLNKVQKPKVISSTSDESNTEAINETPCYVNTRRKTKKEVIDAPRKSFDENVVEEFFSQHFTENKAGEIVISPTLAKKINETSSETSENFGENLNLTGDDLKEIVPYDFNNIEVLQCLNNMVDKVCDDFDKCTKYLQTDNEITIDPDDSIQENLPLKDIINIIQESKKPEDSKKPESKKKIKLKYKITPKKTKTRASRKRNKLVLEFTSKMSTIIEDKGLESAESVANDVLIPVETVEPKVDLENNKKESPSNDTADVKTPLMRRKRKLYSPKDDEIRAASPQAPEENLTSELIQIKKTPKSTATCYKDIEKDRQRYIRMPRLRKGKTIEPLSPRTKKMNDIFDKVKESADGEKVKLADKTFELDVYNFTSDSDDDFKVKKIAISKRNSTTTVGSVESAVSKRGRTVKRINYTDNKSSDESNNNKRKVNRKPRTKKKVNIERHELVDERMRTANDVLNTSIVINKTDNTVKEPDLILEKAPEMEIIENNANDKPEINHKKKGKKNKMVVTESKRLKRVLNKAVVEKVVDFDDDRTESPLPGLLVEPITVNKDDTNEITATLVDKFRKIYQDGPENYIEPNTSQNLLSDYEKVPICDTTEEFIQIVDQIQSKKSEPIEKNKAQKKTSSVILKSSKKEKQTPKKNSKECEIINISEITEEKSDKSIATIGITGHGELEEDPPSPKLIHERLEPRNLEVAGLSHDMKDYFDQLTHDYSGSNEEMCEIYNKTKSVCSKSKSPVVSVKRLSSEDISRWLPSRRNSDSDQSHVSAKTAIKHDSKENITRTTESPIVSKAKRDDNDSEVSEINDPIRKSLRQLFKDTQSSKYNNSAKSKHSGSDSDNDEPLQQVKKKARVSPIIEPKKKISKVTEKAVKNRQQKRASMISPIKLFEDLISNADKQSETTLSDDEGYMKEIINTLTQQKKKVKSTKTVSSVSSHSKISTSTKIEEPKMSLKRTLEGERVNKKRKVEMNLECISSGVTMSSVDDWFKRMGQEESSVEVLNTSMKQVMQEVMERLDTTLVEKNRDTTKKFANLFIDAQKYLCEHKDTRRSMYGQVAADIISDVVNIMDKKFLDLDKRLQKLDDEFMDQLKKKSLELIREDRKNSKVIVQILREDVQAVLDHIERRQDNK